MNKEQYRHYMFVVILCTYNILYTLCISSLRRDLNSSMKKLKLLFTSDCDI